MALRVTELFVESKTLSTGECWFNYVFVLLFYFRFFDFHCQSYQFFPFEQTYKDFQVKRAVDCTPNNQTYAVKFRDLKIEFRNPSFNIRRGEIVVYENLPKDLQVQITIERCNLYGELCMNFDTMTVSNFCRTIDNPLMLAYRIAETTQPRIHCPIQSGTYQFTNASILPTELTLRLPLEGSSWNVKIISNMKTGPETRNPIFCFDAGFVVTKRRVRNN